MTDELHIPDLRDDVRRLTARLAELERRGPPAAKPDAEPVGTVKWGIFATIPSGYLPCDGSSTNGYPALQSALAAAGWSSSATPDLRGRFVLSAGSGYSLADTGGAVTHSLVEGEMPAHNHTGAGGSAFLNDGPSGDVADPSLSTGGGSYARWSATGARGNGDPHNNMPPYIALTAIIRAS